MDATGNARMGQLNAKRYMELPDGVLTRRQAHCFS
jgi:hypothetical protein